MIAFEKCLRLYRFYEALALYDLYYDRVDAAVERDVPSVMAQDRPLTWVPLVFHCTNLKSLQGILEDGFIHPGSDKTYVSFTELPVAELTRMRILGPRTREIAIGFPRALLETRGLFQPAYLMHLPEEIRKQFEGLPPGYVESGDDLGALHEVRINGKISLDDAVWILSSIRNETTGKLDHPILEQCKSRGIALSFWHSTHQEGMLQEPVYRKETRNAGGDIESVNCSGAHYFLKDLVSVGIDSSLVDTIRQEAKIPSGNFQECEVSLPVGKNFNLNFPSFASAKSYPNGWTGPYSNIEMAGYFHRLIQTHYSERVGEVHPRVKVC